MFNKITLSILILTLTIMLSGVIVVKQENKDCKLKKQGITNQGRGGVDEERDVLTSDLDTSDWKTYRNEEYGFEFKYPESWNLAENEDAGSEWQYNQKDWKLETYNGNERFVSVDGSDRLLYLSEVKSLPIDEPVICNNNSDKIPQDGMQVVVAVKKTLDETFDSILKKCEFLTDPSISCDTRFVNSNGYKMLVIDNPNTLCGYPSAYIISNDKLYSIKSLWSNSVTSDTELYNNLFYSFVENFTLN